jgi:Tfp pilus assembly protein PilN
MAMEVHSWRRERAEELDHLQAMSLIFVVVFYCYVAILCIWFYLTISIQISERNNQKLNVLEAK